MLLGEKRKKYKKGEEKRENIYQHLQDERDGGKRRMRTALIDVTLEICRGKSL